MSSGIAACHHYRLNHGLEAFSKQEAAATVIQRAVRKWIYLRSEDCSEIESLYTQMKGWSENSPVRYPRLPLQSRSISPFQCTQVLSSFPSPEKMDSIGTIVNPDVIIHVTFEQFKQKLEAVVDEFLLHLMSLPAQDRGYVIVTDMKEKSNNWVLSLCLPQLAKLPPVDVLCKGNFKKFYDNPQIKHIVFLDDAAYSGEQMGGDIEETAQYVRYMRDFKAIHVLVPYLSHHAVEKIKADMHAAGLENRLFFPTYAQIPSVSELPLRSPSRIDRDAIEDFVSDIEQMHSDLSPEKVRRSHLISFDHKIPDSLSVITPLMESLVGPVTPPYKEEFDELLDRQMEAMPVSLRVDLLPGVGKGVQESVVVVEREGLLLLATKSYLEESVTLTRGGKIFTLQSAEMLPLYPGDGINVEGIGGFQYDGISLI